jgi:hypothetical protein
MPPGCFATGVTDVVHTIGVCVTVVVVAFEVIQSSQHGRDCRHYFNTIDRQLLCRRDYNANRRLHRLVFIETGKQRSNTHIHFFIKGTHLKQYRHIKAACEVNWRRHIRAASDCIVLDNIDFAHERSGYCWKEYDRLCSETLFTQCCHLPHPRT